MNDFNPVRYAMQMQILGYGLMVAGIVMLILVAISFTRIHNNSKENRRG
jgi:hypothetical protein